jgi:hypothetical protein
MVGMHVISRWITLRGMRAIHWAERAEAVPAGGASASA